MRLTFPRIIEAFDKIGPYKSHTTIVGGAALVMHGLRATAGGLDVTFPIDQMRHPDRLPDEAALREALDNMGENNISLCRLGITKDLIGQGTVMIDGISVLSLPALLYYYQELNRPKDQDKIAQLKAVLQSQETARQLSRPYNRQRIIDTISKSRPNRPHPTVVGTAALVLHGLCEEAENLTVTFPIEEFHYPEAHDTDPVIQARVDSIIPHALTICPAGLTNDLVSMGTTTIDGISVLTRPALLSYYEKFGQPKDQEKIKILRQVLEQLEIARGVSDDK